MVFLYLKSFGFNKILSFSFDILGYIACYSISTLNSIRSGVTPFLGQMKVNFFFCFFIFIFIYLFLESFVANFTVDMFCRSINTPMSHPCHYKQSDCGSINVYGIFRIYDIHICNFNISNQISVVHNHEKLVICEEKTRI